MTTKLEELRQKRLAKNPQPQQPQTSVTKAESKVLNIQDPYAFDQKEMEKDPEIKSELFWERWDRKLGKETNRLTDWFRDPTLAERERAKVLSEKRGTKVDPDALVRKTREGFIESTLVPIGLGLMEKLGFSDPANKDYERYKEKTLKEILEEGRINPTSLRQGNISDVAIQKIYGNTLGRSLGLPNEEVLKTLRYSGIDIEDKDSGPEKVFRTIQKAVDAVLPAYAATGIVRRMYDNTPLKMPNEFRLDDQLEQKLVEVTNLAKTQDVEIGPEQGFPFEVKIPKGCDVRTARELVWNSVISYAKNSLADVGHVGAVEDLAMIGSVLIPGASIYGLASKGIALGSKIAGKAGAATVAKNLDTLSRVGTLLLSKFPARLQGVASAAGHVLDQAVTMGTLSAISQPGNEWQAGLIGGATGGLLTGIIQAPTAIYRTIKPLPSVDVRPKTPDGSEAIRQSARAVNEKIKNLVGDAREDLQDPRVFDYIVRESMKNPEVRKTVNHMFEVLNPDQTVNKARHTLIVNQVKNSLSERFKELEQKSKTSVLSPVERQEMEYLSGVQRDLKDYVFKHPDVLNKSTSEFIEHIEQVFPSLSNVVKRYAQQEEYSEEAYLTNYMAQVLSNPFIDKNIVGDEAWKVVAKENFGLEINDPLIESLKAINTDPKYHEYLDHLRVLDLTKPVDTSHQATRQLIYEVYSLADDIRNKLDPHDADLLDSAIPHLDTVMVTGKYNSEVMKDISRYNEMITKVREIQEQVIDKYNAIHEAFGREKIKKGYSSVLLRLDPESVQKVFNVLPEDIKSKHSSLITLLSKIPINLRSPDKNRRAASIYAMYAKKLSPALMADIRYLKRKGVTGLEGVESIARDLASGKLSEAIKEHIRFEKRLNELLQATDDIAVTKELQFLRNQAPTDIMRRKIDLEMEKRKPAVLEYYQSKYQMDATTASKYYDWRYRDPETILDIHSIMSGLAYEHMNVNFNFIVEWYSSKGRDLTRKIAEGYKNKYGVEVDPDFVHSFLLRLKDPSAFVESMTEYRGQEFVKKTLKNAFEMEEARSRPLSLASWTAHTQSLEYIFEKNSLISSEAILGRYQMEMKQATNLIGAFYNKEQINALVSETSELMKNREASNAAKLIDGVRGVRTLFVESSLDAKPTMTATGELLQELLSLGHKEFKEISDEEINRIAKSRLQDVDYMAKLFNQTVREGSDFGAFKSYTKRVRKEFEFLGVDEKIPHYRVLLDVEKLKELKARNPQAYEDIAMNTLESAMKWMKGYFEPVDVEATKLGLGYYLKLRELDIECSKFVDEILKTQGKQWGFELNGYQHRARRVFNTPIERFRFSDFFQLEHDVRGISRIYGTSDKGQLAKAQSFTLSDVDNLHSVIIRDTLSRIHEAQTAHVVSVLRDKMARYRYFGFKEIEKALGEFLYNTDYLFLNSASMEVTKILSQVKSLGIGKIYQYQLAFSQAIFSHVAYLGRATKPIKEGLQTLYLAAASTSLFSGPQGFKRFAVLAANPFINFFKSLGIIGEAAVTYVKTGKVDTSKYGMRKLPTKDPLRARLIEIGNDVAASYRDSGKFTHARQIALRSLAGENYAKMPEWLEKPLDQLTRLGGDIYEITKETQEMLTTQTAITVAESVFRELCEEFKRGVPVGDVCKKASSKLATTSEIRMTQIIGEIFGAIKERTDEGILKALQDPQVAKLYGGYLQTMIDTITGRYGTISGSRVSRIVAKVSPSLAMYAVPKTLFLDRFIVRPLLSAVSAKGSEPLQRTMRIISPMLLPYVTYYGISKLMEIADKGVLGSDSWLPEDLANYIDEYAKELAEDAPYPLRKALLYGFNIGSESVDIAPTWLSKGKFTRKELSDLTKEALARPGFERGISDLVGMNSWTAISSLFNIYDLVKIVKARNQVQTFEGIEWSSVEEYRESLKQVYKEILDVLPENTRKKYQKKIDNAEALTPEEWDEIEKDLEIDQWDKVSRVLYSTSVAPLAFILNPGLMYTTWKEFTTPDTLEQFMLANKYLGIPPTVVTDPLRWFSQVLHIYIEAGVIDKATHDKVLKDYEAIFNRDIGRYDLPGVSLPAGR